MKPEWGERGLMVMSRRGGERGGAARRRERARKNRR